MHGEGELIFFNRNINEIYKGTFNMGKKHGKGKKTLTD